MANLIVHSLFSVLLLTYVDACSGKKSNQCLDSDYPVCATNGTHWFLFKNQCRVDTENIKRGKHGVSKLQVTKISNCFKKCDQVCTNEHAPICAITLDVQKSFQNRCQLDQENCRSGNIWKILHEGECPAIPTPPDELPHPYPLVLPLPQQPPSQPNDHPMPQPQVQPLSSPYAQQPSYPQAQPLSQPQIQHHPNQQIQSPSQPNLDEQPHLQTLPNTNTQPLPNTQEQPLAQNHLLRFAYPHEQNFNVQPFINPEAQPIPQALQQPQGQLQPQLPPYPLPNRQQHLPTHLPPHLYPLDQPNHLSYLQQHLQQQPLAQKLIHPRSMQHSKKHSRSHPKLIPRPLIVEDQCPTYCSMEFEPICATLNGIDQTFQSQCYLNADMCRSKREWVVKHIGECITSEPQCDEHCPRIYSPMCATFNGENKTFTNECYLDLEICKTRNQWDILYNGECRSPIKNCPTFCPDIFKPVCAYFNGIQRGFPNQCNAQREACKNGEDWRILHEGDCEPEKPSDLPPNQNCPDVCPAVYDPVCAVLRGTKKTFSNGCELTVESCKSGQNWKTLFNGPCENEYEVQPKEPSGVLCTANYEPVCAQLNGLRKTFSNLCQMVAEISRTNNAWALLGPGECETTLPPSPLNPPLLNLPPFPQPPLNLPPLYSQQPFEQPQLEQPPSNVPTLACPLCSDSYEPVCGFLNGQEQTFNNECLLLSENCYSDKKWIVGYKGECRTSDTPRNCPNICPLNYSPVCAVFNGVKRTFPNECELNHEAYRTNAEWVILNVGECDYCPTCSDDVAPVCAEFIGQKRTFDNACKVEAENCRTKSGWKIVSRTSCESNICLRPCPKIYAPVCAINNGEARTFGNICEMQNEACKTNAVWNVVSKGECPIPNDNCPTSCSLHYSPVCAIFKGVSKVFINECFLRSENCKTNSNWEFINAGLCSVIPKLPYVNPNPTLEPGPDPITPTPILTIEPKCQISKCLAFRDPVCATFNGEEQTFSNACYLNNIKCRTGEDWKIIRNGPCRKTTPKRMFWSPFVQIFETDEYIETTFL